MTRLLHLGDLHLKGDVHMDDTLRCLHFVTDLVEDRGIDLVLVPGDVFDGASTPAEREAFADWLKTIAVPVIICRGNHDRPHDLLPFALAPHVQVYEEATLIHVGAIDLLVVPWPERAWLAGRGQVGEGGLQAAQQALRTMLKLMAGTRPDPSRPLVVMGHLAVAGAVSSSGQPLIGREIEAVLGDLEDLSASYVALNHIHKHQELSPGIVYAGSLTARNFGEESEEKGVVVVEIDGEGRSIWQFVPAPAMRWITVHACVVDGAVAESFTGRFTDVEIDEEDWSLVNVRYRYECSEADQSLFDHQAIEQRFAAAHTLKIEPIVDRAERVRAADVASAPTVGEKLAAWGRATDTEIPMSVFERLHELTAPGGGS